MPIIQFYLVKKTQTKSHLDTSHEDYKLITLRMLHWTNEGFNYIYLFKKNEIIIKSISINIIKVSLSREFFVVSCETDSLKNVLNKMSRNLGSPTFEKFSGFLETETHFLNCTEKTWSHTIWPQSSSKSHWKWNLNQSKI